LNPLMRFQRFCALCSNWSTIVGVVSREPQLRKRLVRRRTVEKIDAIGLVVRMCTQCSAVLAETLAALRRGRSAEIVVRPCFCTCFSA
jgi:hypothetical protein